MTENSKPSATKYLKLAPALVLLALFVLQPQPAKSGMAAGLNLCYQALIPALFPFLVLTDYLYAAFCEAFGGRGSKAAALIVAYTGGFVAGASVLRRLVESGSLSRQDGSRLLASFANSGPAFTVCAVGIGMFKSARLGYLLLAALYLASAAVYFLFGCHKIKLKSTLRLPPASLAGSISVGVKSTAALSGAVLFGSCIVGYASAAGLSGAPLAAIYCIIEISGGCSAAAGGRYLYLAAAAISLLSASVLMQLRLVVAKGGISLRPLLASRLLHLPLTLLFLRLLLVTTSGIEDAFAAFSGAELFSLSPLFSLLLFLTAAVALLQNSSK